MARFLLFSRDDDPPAGALEPASVDQEVVPAPLGGNESLLILWQALALRAVAANKESVVWMGCTRNMLWN